MAARQIANLQGLRGIAALLVAAYHVQPLLNRNYGQSLHSHAGVFGVDIFFVLSGFVMFYSNPELSGARRFLLQRFFRIVPLYWLATSALIILFLLGFRPVGLHQLDARIVAESLAFIPSTFQQGRHDLILTVGWTLMFELFFYLSFVLTFPLRSLERSFVVLAMAFGALSLFGQLVQPLPYLLQFFSSPIMLEFLYGAAFAILFLRSPDFRPAWLPWAGLALLLLGFSASVAQDVAGLPLPNKHDARFLILGAPAMLVVGGALAMERGGWVLKNNFLLQLGAASYALYLFHPLILQLAVKGMASILASPGFACVAAIVAVATCVGFAFAIHWSVEKPLLAWSRRLTLSASRSARAGMPALSVQPAEVQ